MSLPKNVTIYTDGACSGNPGPGGYGVVLLYKAARRELSGGFRWTTNNRMELYALVEAVGAIKEPCHLVVHSDSQYLLGGIGKRWIEKWKRNGWKTADRSDVQNRDLWMRLDTLLAEHSPIFHWVKGHSTDQENRRCDILAVEASRNQTTRVDAEYELSNPYPELRTDGEQRGGRR